jgi:hypothetical protein
MAAATEEVASDRLLPLCHDGAERWGGGDVRRARARMEKPVLVRGVCAESVRSEDA